MLKLEHVSTSTLSAAFYAPNLEREIDRYNLVSIKDLLEEMEEFKDTDWSPIKERLDDVIKIVERSNKRGVQPVIYETKEYIDSSLNYTDTLNTGRILLLDNPTNYNSGTFFQLKNIPINKIKNYLRTTTPYGDNYLEYWSRNIGPVGVKKILNALDMYHEQVLRQAKLTSVRDDNVFTYGQKEKMDIVRDEYSKIIPYLLCNTKEFVWGELSDHQKNLYISSIVNNKQLDATIRESLIANIANYTTLEELDSVLKGNYKVLKRFIKR